MRKLDILARLLAFCVLAGLLAGCATTPHSVPSQARVVPTADALVLVPPGSVAMLGVVETRYVNATEQLIALETRSRTPGQNFIRVQSFDALEAHSSTAGGLQDVPLVHIDMAGEARGTVNFADMHLSPYFVQNHYGPFGYSVGRTATADTCMYAWQRIAPSRPFGGAVHRGAINIRMQLCDRAYSEQELVSVMTNLRVQGVTGLPVGVISAVGQPQQVLPMGQGGFQNVLDPLPRPAPQPATPSVTPAEPTAPMPTPQGPVVPEPSIPPEFVVPNVPMDTTPIVPSPIFDTAPALVSLDLYLVGFV